MGEDKRKRVGEFCSREPILQLVQSFLTSKEAARTTALSKSWRSAWLTRPNLDFDQTDFRPGSGVSSPSYDGIDPEFMNLSETTLTRYEKSNLKIKSFRLWLYRQYYYSDEPRRLTNMIVRALKIGATDLNLQLDSYIMGSDIPDAVFESENLVALTLESCKVMTREAIACSMLQSLSLHHVKIQAPGFISHILSSCPVILKLSLRRIHVDGDSHCNNVAGDGLTTIRHHRLRCLVLDDVAFDTLFLGDLSSKFSSLRDFNLTRSFRPYGVDTTDILISSCSLERLDVNIIECTSRCKFDVPSIRKFAFGCSDFPKLSIKPNSRGWESHVIIRRDKCFDASWFCGLSKFLKKFRRSTLISLSLHVSSTKSFNYEPGDIKAGLPMREIENLNIYLDNMTSMSCHALFDGLFRVCRPKVITQYMYIRNQYNSRRITKADNIDFLGRTILRVLDTNISKSYQFMYGLNDLKEARAQVFDKDISAEWRDAPLDALSDDSKTPQENLSDDDMPLDELSDDPTSTDESDDDSETREDYPVVRFQLNWIQ